MPKPITALQKMLNVELESLRNDHHFQGDNRIPEDLMLVVKCKDGHIHGVYPAEGVAEELIMEAMGQFNIGLGTPEQKASELPKRIVFHNRQAIGDILMFTCGIRDFKKAFPKVKVKATSTAMHIWDHNPNLDPEPWGDIIDPVTLKGSAEKPSDKEMSELNKRAIQMAIEQDKAVKLYIGPGYLTNASNRTDLHFSNAYRLSIENVLGVTIPQGPIRPDIYMTEAEFNVPPIIEPPYWLITAGEKGDWTCKTFAFEKWRSVVQAFPNFKFVQLGSKGHKHPILDFPNVVNFIGQTEDRHKGVRDLFNLFLNCEGSMGLVSFQMHLAAAFNKPCIVIAGAREPVHFTRYPGQQYLATDGCLSCTHDNDMRPSACWFCSIERCPQVTEYEGQKVPLCADMITFEEVVKSIENYYIGGRLSYTKPSEKPRFINVMKTEISHIPPTPKIQEPSVVQNGEHKFSWGGSSLTDRDWDFIKGIITEYDVRTILEFGCGLSTLLFEKEADSVTSFENDNKYLQQLAPSLGRRVKLYKWDGREKPSYLEGKRWDFAFVDGPGGGENREFSTKYASEHADIIVVHDAGRRWEKKWQEEYLEPEFMLKQKGGHRCHLWVRMDDPVRTEPEHTLEVPAEYCRRDKKLVRFHCNTGAFGGGERSPVWMMNRLIDKGFDVEVVPMSGKVCEPIKNLMKDEVEIWTDFRRLKDPCDVLVFYCNDHVYDGFRNSVYDEIQADRKVMVLNYQLGYAGQLKWTLGWDKYLFLNTTKESALQKRIPGAITKALAPAVDVSAFFDVSVEYNKNLRMIRHSSQGDNKWPEDTASIISELKRCRSDVHFLSMPGPTFVDETDWFVKYKVNAVPVIDFLRKGNLFWYRLPKGYEDQGPRVIMEAQAAGLPIIADDHSGPHDRVAEGTGWLCRDDKDYVEVVGSLNSEILEKTGIRAREWAKQQYDPENWIREILE